MINKFSITQWGRIEWDKVDNKIEIKESEIIAKLREIGVDVNKKVYVLWDNASLPAIKGNLIKIIEVIDDVAAVSFDTWLFCSEDNYVIELYHENTGIALVGWIK
jgi:hypothetical protein